MSHTQPGSPPGDERGQTERGLVELVAQGDEAAFMTIYDRYADALFGTALRFLRDREAAAGSLAGWLHGIGRNQAIDRLRADARRPQPLRSAPASQAARDTGAADGLDWASARLAAPVSEEPSEETDRRWLRALLRTTLSEMQPDEREVLALAYDHGLSQSEIAERLGLPIGTGKSRTRRGPLRPRARLGDIPDLNPATAVSTAFGGPEVVR